MDNRKFIRLPSQVDIKFDKLSFNQAEIKGNIKGKSKNISQSGIAFEAGVQLQTDDPLCIEINIPNYSKYKPGYKFTDPINSISIKAIGIVKYQNNITSIKYETGIAFASINMDDVLGIKKYIKEIKGKNND